MDDARLVMISGLELARESFGVVVDLRRGRLCAAGVSCAAAHGHTGASCSFLHTLSGSCFVRDMLARLWPVTAPWRRGMESDGVGWRGY